MIKKTQLESSVVPFKLKLRETDCNVEKDHTSHENLKVRAYQIVFYVVANTKLVDIWVV